MPDTNHKHEYQPIPYVYSSFLFELCMEYLLSMIRIIEEEKPKKKKKKSKTQRRNERKNAFEKARVRNVPGQVGTFRDITRS
jgi:hypothetical protein